jgi:hypothetical protein
MHAIRITELDLNGNPLGVPKVVPLPLTETLTITSASVVEGFLIERGDAQGGDRS